MSSVTPFRLGGEPPALTVADAETESVLRSKRVFYVIVDGFDLPLAGAPKPLPCPFCGSSEINIALDRREDNGMPKAHVECECCGTESCWTEEGRMGYDVALEAARMWNKRAQVKKR